MTPPGWERTHAQFAHDAWATGQILDRCRSLSLSDFRRSFPIGLGSLERTLAHIIDVMDFFADALAERPYEERADFEEGSFTPEALLPHLGRASEELEAVVRERLSDGTAAVDLPHGSGRAVPLAVFIVQIFDHATHHRAQCLFMLKELGVALEVHPLRWAGLDPGD